MRISRRLLAQGAIGALVATSVIVGGADVATASHFTGSSMPACYKTATPGTYDCELDVTYRGGWTSGRVWWVTPRAGATLVGAKKIVNLPSGECAAAISVVNGVMYGSAVVAPFTSCHEDNLGLRVRVDPNASVICLSVNTQGNSPVLTFCVPTSAAVASSAPWRYTRPADVIASQNLLLAGAPSLTFLNSLVLAIADARSPQVAASYVKLYTFLLGQLVHQGTLTLAESAGLMEDVSSLPGYNTYAKPGPV